MMWLEDDIEVDQSVVGRGLGITVEPVDQAVGAYGGMSQSAWLELLVRPQFSRDETLPQVRLLVHAAEDEVLNCTWKATAGNGSGQLQGSFSLTVRASTMDFDAESN